MDMLVTIIAIPIVYALLVRVPMALLYRVMPESRLKTFLFRVRWG